HHAAPFHEAAHLGEREPTGVGPQDHAGAHALAGCRVGHADHGHVGDLGVRRQLVLDALRGQVLALANDDVLAAARDAQEALAVRDGEISAAEEPVRSEGRVEGGVEIAHAQLGAVGLYLALDACAHGPALLVDDAGDGAGYGPPVRAVQL